MLLLLDWAGPALACRLASIVLQATAGAHTPPCAPSAACCQAGRRRESVFRLVFWRRGRKPYYTITQFVRLTDLRARPYNLTHAGG